MTTGGAAPGATAGRARSGTVAVAPRRRRRHSRATLFLTAASAFALAVLMVAIVLPELQPAPSVRWSVGEGGGAGAEPEQFMQVAAGTPLRLHLDLPWPAHAYVASFVPLQGAIALFPSERLLGDVQNPLPAGAHVLPQPSDRGPAAWPASDVGGPVSYLIVVSREPLPDVEQAFTEMRQMGNTLWPDRSMFVFMPQKAPRDTAAMLARRSELPTAALGAANALVQARVNGRLTPWPGHAGVWLGTLKLTVEAGADPSWLEPLLRGVREHSGARAEPQEPPQPKAGDGR